MRRLARISALLVISFILSYTSLYILRIAAGRILPVEEFGTFIFIYGLSSILAVLSVFGMDSSLSREIAQRVTKKKEYSTLLGGAILLVILLSLLFTLPFFSTFIALLVISYALYILSTGVVRGLGEFERRFLGDIIRTLIVLAGIGILVLYPSYLTVLMILILAFLLSTTVMLYGKKITLPDTPTLKYIVLISFPYLLMAFSSRVLQWTDTVMINYLLGPFYTGIYGAATTLSSILLTVYVVAGYVSLQRMVFFRENNDIEGIRSFFKRVNKWVLLITLPLASFLFMFPSFSLKVVFGDLYSGYDFLLQLLVVFVITHILFGIQGTLYTAINKPNVWNVFALLSTLLNVVLNYVLITLWGVVGAAIATLTSNLLRNLLSSLYLLKMGISPLDVSGLKVFLAFFISLSIERTMFSHLPMVVEGALFIFLYVVMLMVLKTFDGEDKRIFRELLGDKDAM